MSNFSVSAYVELHNMKGGHSDTVNTLAFSPNGTYLASGGDDYALVIWNAAQGSLLYRIMFNSAVDCVIWHPTYPDTVIVGCTNGSLSQIQEFLPMQSEQYEINLGARSTVHCLEYDAHTGRLAIGMGEEVHVTREKTQNRYQGDMIFPSPPDPEAFQQTNNASEQGEEVAPSGPLQRRPEQRLRALALKFHDEGAALIVSYLSHGVYCWDAATRERRWHIPLPSSKYNIGGAAVSPDHRHIAVYNFVDGLDLYLLGAHKKAKLRRSYWLDKKPRTRHKLSVQFIHNGQALVSGTTTGKVSIWETATGEVFQNLEHGEDVVQAVSSTIHDKHSFIATGSAARGQKTYIKIWRAKTLQERGSSDPVANLVQSVTPNAAVLDAMSGLCAILVLIGIAWACMQVPWAVVWDGVVLAWGWGGFISERIAVTVGSWCYVAWLATRAFVVSTIEFLEEFVRRHLRSLLLYLLPELVAGRDDIGGFAHAEF